MKKILEEIEELKSKIGKEVIEKLKSFEKNINFSPEEKFLELCFCILVANYSIKKAQFVWEKVNEGFLYLSEEELKEKLKSLGYRFYNKRANYIVLARKYIKEIDSILKEKNEFEVREWLVENIKGIGWKEASHFLRNLGFKNFAILDRHVLRILYENKIIDEIPSSLSKKKYLEIEEKLRNLANLLKITLAELDLYLFYLATGRISERWVKIN